MTSKDPVIIIAIACIAIIALIAITRNLDGSIVYTAIVAISGLAGYTIGKGNTTKPNQPP